jgi:hypothetical protein
MRSSGSQVARTNIGGANQVVVKWKNWFLKAEGYEVYKRHALTIPYNSFLQHQNLVETEKGLKVEEKIVETESDKRRAADSTTILFSSLLVMYCKVIMYNYFSMLFGLDLVRYNSNVIF